MDFRQFDKDREEVIQRSIDAGVGKIVCVGCDVRSSQACVDLAKKYEFMSATVGIHPSNASEWNDDIANKFIVHAREGEVVGIGEIGLDYYRMRHPEDLQKKVFREQLELAKEVGLPVCVHMRESSRDVYDMLVESGLKRVLLHCFNEELEFAEKCWSYGWVLGFGGPVTYPNNEKLREVVAECPSDQFVLETDCPFLPPQSHRGDRNEPSYIPDIAKVVAEIREEPLSEMEGRGFFS